MSGNFHLNLKFSGSMVLWKIFKDFPLYKHMQIGFLNCGPTLAPGAITAKV
jgi:hypothetical protein